MSDNVQLDKFPVYQEKADYGVYLNEVKEYCVEYANKNISWYVKQKKSKKFFSLWLWRFMLLFIGLGSISPLMGIIKNIIFFILNACSCNSTLEHLGQINITFTPLEFGFVSFAIAGGFYFYDKTMDISSGWMRYMNAKMEIEHLLNNFQLKWVKLITCNCDDVSKDNCEKQVDCLIEFMDNIHSVCSQETNIWAENFKTNLKKISAMTNKNNN